MSNLQLLTALCREITPLLKQLVLVGGCATELLVTDKAAPEVRYTTDVDMLIEAVSLKDYYQACTILKKLGFTENKEVICRWEKETLILDLMPVKESILGFSNSWYPDIVKNKQSVLLDGMTIYHVSAPYFIAAKFEAYKHRGKNDPWCSHDLEDIISVVDGRMELMAELKLSEQNVVQFIADNFRRLMNEQDFIDALPGFLPPDPASQNRLKRLKEKLTDYSNIRTL